MLPRFREGEPLVEDELTDFFETDERGVTLVDVTNRRPELQEIERPQPSDAEHDLLADAHLVVAAVQGGRDDAIVVVVLVDVRVEKEKGHAADLDDADEDVDVALADPDRHHGRAAVRHDRDGDGETVRVHGHARLRLPVAAGQRLPEITVLVEEADSDERQPEVARRLQMVARQDAEAARVNRQELRQAELGGEIRDEVAPLLHGARGGMGRLCVVFDADLGARRLEPRQESGIAGCRFESFRRQVRQKGDRVAARLFPQLGVQRGKKRPEGGPPGPTKVCGEIV